MMLLNLFPPWLYVCMYLSIHSFIHFLKTDLSVSPQMGTHELYAVYYFATLAILGTMELSPEYKR